MATLNFIRIAEKTEKGIKLIVREFGYDLDRMQAVSEKYLWLPKSVCKNLSDNKVDVSDWFFNKNISADTYGEFMKSLANS